VRSRIEPPAINDLVQPALAALPRMLLPSGLACYTVVDGDPEPRGESVRYTLIVLLGLLRAREAGVEARVDADVLRDAVDAALERPEVTPGDLGLRLWAEYREDRGQAPRLVRSLGESLAAKDGVAAREGLELAWIITGLAPYAGAVDGAAELLETSLGQLLGANLAESGLFRHFGGQRRRRRFPNFATEIYSVLALATVARHDGDARALPAACRAADGLISHQLPDGGWPWLYDAERGTVVERYEVYSVHQHGMAPMTLLDLAEVSGEDRYAEAAARGLPWMFGANELNAHMAPLERGLTFRSIRRRPPLDRLWLYSHTAAALAGLSHGGRGRALELNRSCRPYELGWLIEAWAGRDGLSPRSAGRDAGASRGAPGASGETGGTPGTPGSA
jgi:hypothetical protein